MKILVALSIEILIFLPQKKVNKKMKKSIKNSLFFFAFVCLFLFLNIQNSYAQAPKTALTKKQKALVGKWIIKEFDMVFPKDKNDNSEEKKIFEQSFQVQRQMMIGKDIFEIFADGTITMYEDDGKTTKGTWQYIEAQNMFVVVENGKDNQKEDGMLVVWEGNKPTIVFDERMDSGEPAETGEMSMKMVFGKKK